MSDSVQSVGRRNVLARGAAGLAAAAVAVLATRDARATPVSTAVRASTPRTIELYGRGWTARADDLKFGELPKAGERYAVHGELTDRIGGERVGDFASAVFTLAAHGNTVEMHTLNLAGGSIVGMGSGSGVKRTFAIVGGTGLYNGARGSYVAEQDVYGFGGTGTAKLTLTITAEEDEGWR